MIPNNNLSVLPWYGSREQQNARKWWVYGRIYPLYTQGGYILPFQILIPHTETPNINSVVLYNANTDAQIGGNYVSQFSATGMAVKQFSDYDVVVYPADGMPFASLQNGRYYLKATVNYIDYYSEIFTVVNDIQPYLKIRWWDNTDFVMDAGTIVYKEPEFINVLYIKSDIAKPEYLFEEEGETRDGYFFPIKQISEKRYRFNFLASEFLLDVMRFIRMADNVEITYHGEVYRPDTFLITPEWENEGDVAVVSAEFDTATVAKKLPYMEGGYIPPTPTNYLSVTPTNIAFAPAGQQVQITISANTDWVISVPAFITASALSGTGNATVTLTAGANTTGAPRNNTVSVSGVDVPTVTISVSQAASINPAISISRPTFECDAAQRTFYFQIECNGRWECSGSTAPGWLNCSSSGTGDGVATIQVAANSGSQRVGTLTFRMVDYPNVTCTSTITQLGYASPYLTVTPSGTIDKDSAAGTVTFNISSNGSWKITNLNITPWLTIPEQSMVGVGDATIVATVTQNTGVQRTAQLEISTMGVTPPIYVNLNIRQAAPVGVAYRLEFEQGYNSFTWGADGDEQFTTRVQGVTITNGVETSRVSLSASDLSFARSGDTIATRNGLTFSASNLGTTVQRATHEEWTLTWNAHTSATAVLNLYQNANERTVNSRTEDGSFINVPATLVWSGSGTNQANAGGDTMTINPTLRYTISEDVSYSSGISRTETTTLNLGGAVTVSGTGLSVSGSGTNWTVTYAANTGSARNGTITIRQSEPNPFTPTYYYTETKAVSQAGRGYPLQLQFEATDPETYEEGTYYTDGRSVQPNYIIWTSQSFGWSIHTTTNPQVGDYVYLNQGLTTPCGTILEIYY